MKNVFALLVIGICLLTSCFKTDLKDKDEYKKEKFHKCELNLNQFSDKEIWEEHIIEPVQVNESCGNCKVGGVVKYHKIDTDFAYVIYYGKGSCDNEAHVVSYFKDKKEEEKCLLILDCEKGN